jgi:hypothetical protein
MIPMSFTQWLGVNKNHGRVANRDTLGTFYQKYVKPERDRLTRVAPQLYWTAAGDIAARFTQTANAGQFPQAQGVLDQLVGAINGVCLQLGEANLVANPVDRYAANGGWMTEDEAVAAMDGLAHADALPTRRPLTNGAPHIPGVKWSTAKRRLPQNLVNLIRDIRNASRVGGFVDERNQQQLNGRSITPVAPATLRSWHMNDQGSLPAIPLPAASPLHNHYQATSQPPGNAQAAPPAPTGYAEYTGCGIQGDAHCVKLVLEYTNNEVYVTVSHYKRWRKDDGVPPRYTVVSKTEGENSAWFYIDFTS